MSEYDHKMTQSQTTDQPMIPWRRDTISQTKTLIFKGDYNQYKPTSPLFLDKMMETKNYITILRLNTILAQFQKTSVP